MLQGHFKEILNLKTLHKNITRITLFDGLISSREQGDLVCIWEGHQGPRYHWESPIYRSLILGNPTEATRRGIS